MRFLTVCASLFGIALMMIVSAGSANAQASRTWVSGVGDDANPCSRTAPCKTFAGAISKTAAAGEINCLDPGGFGAVTITKAMVINCEETLGSVLVAGTNGIVIAAGANDVVTLKGIEIEGLKASASPGINGVRFTSGGELHMHKFQIRNFAQNGIDVEPSTTSRIYIADGYISNCGANSSQAGILLKSNTGAFINASITNVKIENCSNGVLADGSGGGGAMVAAVTNSYLGGASSNGVSVSSPSTAVTVTVTGSVMTSNIGAGAAVSGNGASMRLGANTIVNNATGATFPSGSMQSFKNNMFAGNLSDGTPIPAVPGNSGTQQ